VLTFEPHPRAYFQPDKPAFRLTPFRIKLRQLDAIGVDYLYLLSFDRAMAQRSPESFIVEVLGQGLEPIHLVVGYDFVFGKGRSGNAAMLGDLGRAAGFSVTSVPAAADAEGVVYSSTKVRERLAAGGPLGAARVLGRPWEIEGRVESGDKRGRLLGFPTANVAIGAISSRRWASCGQGRHRRGARHPLAGRRRRSGLAARSAARGSSSRPISSISPAISRAPSPGGADRFHPARAQVRRAGGPQAQIAADSAEAGAAGRHQPAARPCAPRLRPRGSTDPPRASQARSSRNGSDC
jgi:hypothetical protein